jgi:hypothetical protein
MVYKYQRFERKEDKLITVCTSTIDDERPLNMFAMAREMRMPA